MTTEAVLPQVDAPARTHDFRTALGVALVSFATLLLELASTRLFSVILFYHFAFLAISVALLGLGAGGVFVYLKRGWLARWSTREIATRICLMNAVAILVVLEVELHLPVSLTLDWGNFGRLTVLYLTASVPFFFTGVLFSVIFARESWRISQLYGADLAGGALACLAIVPMLNQVGGPNAVVCAALVMAGAAVLWAEGAKQKIAIVLLVLIAGLLVANRNGALIDIVYAKGQRRDQPWMLWSKWNAISRIEVNQIDRAKYIVIDADATSAIMNVDPDKWWEDAPSQTPVGTGLPETSSYNWKKDLMSTAPAIANVLRPKGEFAIIGPGGGVDVLRAVANGSEKVTGIEINPLIANDIMRGDYAEYSYHLYTRPEVRIHVADGRSWIRNSKDKYEVIQMTLVDTWASTAAGAFALSENNLYTVEAFKEYFAHLKDDGFIAITRWEFAKPREALRVVSQAQESLRQLGVADARQHFIIVSDGPLNADGRPVTVLARKTPFTQAEVDVVTAVVTAHPNLYVIYLPLRYSVKVASPEARKPFVELIQKAEQREQWIAQYPYDITPVSDDAPFFFFTIKTKDVIAGILDGSGRGMDWRINMGITVLAMLLVISILAVLAFLIIPMALHAPARHQSIPHLLYFVAVGLGYIMIEIAFIQKFVLFLGHPTYALTVVVFLMLLSSGAGSVVARRWLPDPRRVWMVILAVVAAGAVYFFVLPMLLGALIGAAFALKLLVSALVLAPLGFIMGMPFPSGLRMIAGQSEGGVEWAWAMNASATVLGSVSAMVIAIHFGISVTLACGAAAYLAAALLTRTWKPAAA